MVAFATLVFTTAPAATPESWPQCIVADWLLAEEVAAQYQLGGRNLAKGTENAKVCELSFEPADLKRIQRDVLALGQPAKR